MSVAINLSDKPSADRQRRLALIIGAGALAFCALGLLFGPAYVLRAYHVAYQYVLGIALGSLALLMLQYVTGGAWGLVLRPYLEAAVRTLPLLVVAFLPLLVGLSYLFPWISEPPPHNRAYLNAWWFVVRSVAYFAIWLLLSFFLNLWSVSRERRVDPERPRTDIERPRPLRLLSAVGLLLHGLAVSFAAVDWVMSLEPEWYSTIYPVLFAVGQVISALAFGMVVLLGSASLKSAADTLQQSPLRDLGSMLLAFVMLWAYMSFSQYLIIWSGNLPEEVAWYVRRTHGPWQAVAVFLAAFHFGLPFLLLLSRDVKQMPWALAAIALLILAMHYLDVLWWIEPAPSQAAGLGLAEIPVKIVLHLAALIGLGGVWLWAFLGQLQKRPPPSWETVLAQVVHHE
jgi:hypothetical protein